MNGGIIKAAGHGAIAALAGLLLSTTSVRAADLGGNCCADLEERIAELEATTARKGNRRMSLTITGHINRSVMYWNDGRDSKTYYGLDNTQSSSRFSILGEAKVQPKMKVGFELMMEMEFGNTTSGANQFDEDGKAGSHIGGSAASSGLASLNANSTDPIFGGVRRAAWWIEHQDLGRLTVGRYDTTGVVSVIDLGGVTAASGATMSTASGGLFFRPTGASTTNFSVIRITDVTEGGNNGTTGGARNELIRYDSPALHGFVVSGHMAEAGDYWGAMIRYAGEFSGFRLAAGIGYENIRDRATNVILNPTTDFAGADPDIRSWGGSVAVMHLPTGLFVQGHYQSVDFGAAPSIASGYYNQQAALQPDGTDFRIQAGVAKNWFGYGNTVLYGEYAKSTGFGAREDGRNFTASTSLTAFTNVNGVTDTEVRQWGLGIVQNLDAAATELYVSYRNYSLDVTQNATGIGQTGKASFEDIQVIQAGARVKF